MSCVHYKFFSKLKYDTVIFDGLHISVCDLKEQIMGREKLKATHCDLQICNAETKEEYADDNDVIRRNSSVLVRRIPVGGVVSTSKTYVLRQTKPVSGTSKAKAPNSLRRQVAMPSNVQWEAKTETKMKTDDSSASISLAQLMKTANLAEANASEEDKIKAMMVQSAQEYDPINYVKKPLGPPPPSYTCFRCGKPGHYIKNCPTNGDKNFEPPPRIKKSTGIPRSFMMEVKDLNMKGAMLTNTGKYVIPIIDAEAYAKGKKERPPFLSGEPSPSSSEEEEPIPEELLCLICKAIATDAVVIPCCGNSYCDECIRTALLESDEHTCPTCHQNDVSPDALIANKCLRQAVNNFNNETGYTKRLRKQIYPPTPPRPLIRENLQAVRRLPVSRQQDPLKIPAPSTSTHAATSTSSSMTPNQSSQSSAVPQNQPSTPAPVPDITATEKPDGPSRDPDDEIIPATALVADHPKASSPRTISAPVEEKSHQIPVLGAPSMLGQSLLRGQSIPTTDPGRRDAAHSAAAGRPGWKPSRKRGQHLGGNSQRTQGPSLPATPAPPPPPLIPSPQFPPGQPPSEGYRVPPPGFPPAPTHLSTAVQRAHSITIPTARAPLLSREEFYREQRRLQEEEKKKSKLDDFTNDFAKELMERKKMAKKRRRSFSRSKSPHRGSSYSRSSHGYSKSRSGSSSSCPCSGTFSCSHSWAYSRLPPEDYSRRGRGKSRSHLARSRSREYQRSRSRPPHHRRYHSRARSPAVLRGQSPKKRNIPHGEIRHHSRNKGGNYPEKLSASDGHTMKGSAKSKEKEKERPPGDGKGSRHEKRQKRRKEEECEEFPKAELLENSRGKRKY